MIHPSEAPKKPIINKNCFNKLSKAYSKENPNKELKYKYRTKNHTKVPAQYLTKKLKILFNKYNIEIKYNKWGDNYAKNSNPTRKN